MGALHRELLRRDLHALVDDIIATATDAEATQIAEHLRPRPTGTKAVACLRDSLRGFVTVGVDDLRRQFAGDQSIERVLDATFGPSSPTPTGK